MKKFILTVLKGLAVAIYEMIHIGLLVGGIYWFTNISGATPWLAIGSFIMFLLGISGFSILTYLEGKYLFD